MPAVHGVAKLVERTIKNSEILKRHSESRQRAKSAG